MAKPQIIQKVENLESSVQSHSTQLAENTKRSIVKPLSVIGETKIKTSIHNFNNLADWTKTTTTGTTLVADTINFRTNVQAIKATASGVTKVEFNRLKSIDLANKIIYVDFYVDDETKLDRIAFTFYATGGVKYVSYAIQRSGYIKTGWNTFPLPIATEGSKFGGFTDTDLSIIVKTEISVFPVTGQTINVTFDEMYTTINQLKKAKFTFHFDDGLLGVFREAKPLMDAYGFKGVTYVITDNVEQSNFMNLNQLNQLQDLGWDISSHTKSHKYFKDNNLTMTEIEDELALSKQYLIDNGFYKGARHLTLPGGTTQYNASILSLIKKYYTTHRTMVPMIETVPATDWNNIYARVIADTTTVDTVKTLIDKTIAAKGWLNLVFHDVVTTPIAETQYSIANFIQIVDYLGSKKAEIDVVTTSDVIDTTEIRERVRDLDSTNSSEHTNIINQINTLTAKTGFGNRYKEHIFNSKNFSITLNNISNANRRALIELTIAEQGSGNGTGGGKIAKYICDVFLEATLTNTVISTTKIYGVDKIITITVSGLTLNFSIDSTYDQMIVHTSVMSLYDDANSIVFSN